MDEIDDEVAMFEMPPNFHDETPLVLTADQRAVALYSLAKIADVWSYLKGMVEKDDLTIGQRFSGLGNLNTHVERLYNAMGYEADAEQNRQSDRKRMRQLHDEIDKMKEQLAGRVTMADVSSAISVANSTIRGWWRTLGFSYCTTKMDHDFGTPAFTVDFQCELASVNDAIFDEEPETAKRRLGIAHGLLDDKLDLGKYASNGQPNVRDTDRNRVAIPAMIKSRFPKATTWKIHAHRDGNDGTTLHVVVARIPVASLDINPTSEVV